MKNSLWKIALCGALAAGIAGCSQSNTPQQPAGEVKSVPLGAPPAPATSDKSK